MKFSMRHQDLGNKSNYWPKFWKIKNSIFLDISWKGISQIHYTNLYLAQDPRSYRKSNAENEAAHNNSI
jgi:hypothetical protein